MEDRYAGFPPGFFERADPGDDRRFYEAPRIVTHLDDGAITAVGHLYEELEVNGTVLDLMSSWVSHFVTPPAELVALGMNHLELERNEQASAWVVHDLNADPGLPFADGRFDAVVCCVSVDYLTRPLEVFDEVHRVLRPGGLFVNTFSNRCFPTKAVRGWLLTDDDTHVGIVTEYYRRSGPWRDLRSARRTPDRHRGDPLYAVWAATDR
jgi:SAM-dependent methyltransferase